MRWIVWIGSALALFACSSGGGQESSVPPCDCGTPSCRDVAASVDVPVVAPDLVDAGADGSEETTEAPVCEGALLEVLPPSLVHTEGDRVVDSHGRTVMLRGINLSGGPVEGSPEVLDSFEFFGFNVVRMVLGWGYLEPEEGVLDEDYLAALDAFLDEAEERGLYVILDMHQGFWHAYGMPEWTCDEDISGADDIDGTMLCAAAFYENEALMEAFRDNWRMVVTRYGERAHIWGYDLWNEPPPPDYAQGISGLFERDFLFDFYVSVAEAIREIDTEHIVMIEPNWLHAPTLCGYEIPFPDENVVYAPHLYPPHAYTGAKA